MFDASKTKYRLLVMAQDGTQYNIKNFATDLGWEQNAGELATRISFAVYDEKLPAGRISKLAKPGCLVVVTAQCESHKKDEVARGYITDWVPKMTSKKRAFKVTAYDELFNLQKSQDTIYYSDGTSTRTIVTDIIGRWGIPLGSYQGPDVSHDKMAFSSKKLSEIIYDTLDDAVKKGGHHALLDAQKGVVSIIPWGTNDEVWCFENRNTVSSEYKISTADMVTRVKVIGEENDDGRSAVEAVLDGRTEFGIRQKIVRKGTDDSAEDARNEAQEILDKDGNPKETVTVQAPDVPFIRKGHRVFCRLSYVTGYFYVKGIRHDASSGTMTMDLTKKESED